MRQFLLSVFIIAFFTGKMYAATSVSGLMGWNCEYQANGQYFWQFHQGFCPSSINVY